MTQLENVKRALETNKRNNDKQYAAMMRAAKQPAIQAFQNGQLSAEEYEEAVGEPFAATIKDIYDSEVERAREGVANRVKFKKLSREDYKAIVGEDYPEEA